MNRSLLPVGNFGVFCENFSFDAALSSGKDGHEAVGTRFELAGSETDWLDVALAFVGQGLAMVDDGLLSAERIEEALCEK